MKSSPMTGMARLVGALRRRCSDPGLASPIGSWRWGYGAGGNVNPYDAALAAFRAGDYAAALAGCDDTVKRSPNDSVIHEVRALSLFALVSERAGTIRGQVVSQGADAFDFRLTGAPAEAAPIAFRRQP